MNLSTHKIVFLIVKNRVHESKFHQEKSDVHESNFYQRKSDDFVQKKLPCTNGVKFLMRFHPNCEIHINFNLTSKWECHWVFER